MKLLMQVMNPVNFAIPDLYNPFNYNEGLTGSVKPFTYAVSSF